MKIGPKAQNPLEFAAIRADLLPLPLLHTQIMSFIARAVYDAVELGVFEAVGREGRTLDEIAAACGLDARALRPLLGVLAAMGYFRVRADRFSMPKAVAERVLEGGEESLRDQLVFMRSVWGWLDALPSFLKTGHALHYHASFSPDDWGRYQRAMASIAKRVVGRVARATPMPASPTRMLDVGGSHGYYAAAFCRAHPTLRADILELPEAIEQARGILAREPERQRIEYVAGDAREHDLGESRYDFVLVSSLMHHFDVETNRALTCRIARSLKPGGYFAVLEFIRPEVSASADVVGAVLDLFFALSSASGTWSVAEIKGWQRDAGLRHAKVARWPSLPGFAEVIARKE